MKTHAESINKYFEKVPKEQKEDLLKLRSIINKNIPKGFVEKLSSGFPSFVVPLELYPKGYHCKKNEPLPFISVAAQKNHIALYHLALYSNKEILEWFDKEHLKRTGRKLDFGKSCIRFKKNNQIPFDLIAELVKKISCQEWIQIYEQSILKNKSGSN